MEQNKIDVDVFRVTEEMLAELTECSDLRRIVGKMLIRLEAQPFLFVPVLHVCMEAPDGPRSVVSAFLLLRLMRQCSFVQHSAEIERTASKRLVDAIRQRTSNTTALGCRLLALGPVPSEAVPVLQKYVRSATDETAMAAAIALARTGRRTAKVISLLESGLGHRRPELADGAARVLADMAGQWRKVRRVYLKAMESSELTVSVAAVRALEMVGAWSAEAVPILIQILRDEARAGFLRGLAADRLGAVAAKDSRAAFDALAQALRCDDAWVMEGAARGLKAMGVFPENCGEWIMPHLTGDSGEKRLAAARCLALMGTHAVPAIPALLKMLEDDTSSDLTLALGEAVAACGPSIAMPLYEFVKKHNMSLHMAIGIALQHVDPETVDRIVALAREKNDLAALSIVFILAKAKGAGASRVTAILGDMLEIEEDGDAAYLLVSAIEATGAPDVGAVAGLLRCLLIGEPDLAETAERCLRLIGPAAAPVLTEVLDSVAPGARDRLRRLMRDLAQGEDRRFEKFVEFNNDDKLRMFALVGDILTERGPTGLRVMETILEQRQQIGEIDPSLPTSFGALSEALSQIRAHFGDVSTSSPGRKGGLSELGVLLLMEVKEYLARKDAD